ncbi:MAG: DNA mismatch repair protein MutS [Acidobacteriia bacterium]|nr:DNA mismatch repair protein MutS [Terriglobia bacterium]
MSEAPSTPLMRQYHGIKQQFPNALLLFRLGDFYELFFDDAKIAARELEITLTARNKEKGTPIPMCGVPYHASENYIARLIQKGYRVAICDQTEDPKLAKKLVKREVTRVVTPGTAMNVRSHENNFLAAVFADHDRAGIAHVDVSTGEFHATEVDLAELGPGLEALGPREALIPTGAAVQAPCLRTDVEPWVFGADYAARSLCDHFHLLSLDGCGLENRPLATGAAAAILHYLRETQRTALDHLERPAFYNRSDSLVLDATTIRNLELVEPLFAGESKESTLLHVLDRTRTGMGGRLLRRRLLAPSIDTAEIESRLDAVEDLRCNLMFRAALAKSLESILDLERLLAKVSLSSAGPRDVAALAKSLAVIPSLKRIITSTLPTSTIANSEPRPEGAVQPPAPPQPPPPSTTADASRGRQPGAHTRLLDLHHRLDEIPEVRDQILAALADELPVNLADGGTIRDGFNAALDELRDISRNSRTYIAQIEQRERTRTGIGSLKVRFNNVFGFYIEISKANLQLAPPDYERKQTLVNAERFTTPELKELEGKILEAEEKMLAIEREIFEQLRALASSHAARIKSTAAAVAELDVTVALAEVAVENRYTRPKFSTDGEMRVAASRHPVIEKLAEKDAQRFIPNDLYFHPETEFIAVITGPNMGGKSTYLRQAALLSILAQMGSFVPADAALVPIVDRVFTRIGAADNLARGRSTFMVEMTETAVILNTATPRSLIVLDEIGRGTSTYDGLALAWAVVEHIHRHIRAKTLFATHYHELTELADQLEGVRNLHVSVKESGDQILFLRKVEPGAADRSYGIEVARLAALPISVIERARQILAHHEDFVPREAPVQIRLFEPVNHELADRIRNLNVDNLRPLEALQLLSDLQKELK